MGAIARNRSTVAAAAVGAVWLAAGSVWLAAMHGPHRQLIGIAVALDLTVTAALLHFAIARTPRRALMVVGLGLGVGAAAIPPARPLLGLIEPGLIALTLARLPSARRRYRARRLAGDDRVEALADALGDTLGSRALGRGLALELALVGYAFAGPWRRAPRDGFFGHRRSPWLPTLCVLLFLVVVESAAIHVAVMQISPRIAWLLTILAVYSMLWLVGDYQALRLRPTTIEGGELRVRVGLRWSARLPLAGLVAEPLADGAPRDQPAPTRATVMGPPNVVVRAAGVLTGPLGREKRFAALGLKLDEPERFVAAIAAVRG